MAAVMQRNLLPLPNQNGGMINQVKSWNGKGSEIAQKI